MIESIGTYRNKAPKVAQLLSKDIEWGKYAGGTMLPPDQALASEYSVSRITMRRVLSILADQGQVVKLPQKGVLVPLRKTNPENQEGGQKQEALRTSQKVTIAAFWAAGLDAHIVGIREGVKKYVREMGLGIQFYISPEGHQSTLDFLSKINECDIQGAIVFPYASPEYVACLDRLIQIRFPLVCIDRRVGQLPVSSVESDNAAGEYLATHYLIEKYHRPVYFFGSKLEHQTTLDRYDGYSQAMDNAGFGELVESHTILTEASDFDPVYWSKEKRGQASAARAEKFLEELSFPASVVCLNDYLAHALYQAAQKHGREIGKDLCIVGFDDTPIAKFLRPSLSTIRQDNLQVGYDSAKLLHGIISGKVSTTVNIHVPVELIVRESA